LLPGLADIEGKVGGVDMDLRIDPDTGDMEIRGRRFGSKEEQSSVILTKEEIGIPAPCEYFVPRAFAFARKLKEET
jgi:hypothetical protein